MEIGPHLHAVMSDIVTCLCVLGIAYFGSKML